MEMKGLVMKSTGSWYLVKADAGQFQCRMKGKLRLKGFKTTNPIAVGDWVQFEKRGQRQRDNKRHHTKK